MIRANHPNPSFWAGLILVIAVVGFRLVAAIGMPGSAAAGLANFSPMGAVVLCAAAFFPGAMAVWVPAVALIGSDVILNLHYGAPPLTGGTAGLALAYGLIFGLGRLLRRHLGKGLRTGMRPGRQVALVLGASVVSSVVFYFVTNTVAFLGSPSYPQNIAGWAQAMTTGVPGFTPTYVFFRNELAGSLAFTALFLLLLQPFRRAAGEPGPAPGLEPAPLRVRQP